MRIFLDEGTNEDRMLKLLLVEKDCRLKLEQTFSESQHRIRKITETLLFNTHVRDFAPDAVIISLDTVGEELLAELTRLDKQSPLPVILFTQETCREKINKLIECGVSALFPCEIDAMNMSCILEIAFARFRQRQMLTSALEAAREQLEDRKKIDRAKAILIKTQNYSEDQAYHTLRKLAMERNVTLGEMARKVIAMAEMLK